MQTRGILVGVVIVAALGVVFYSGANRHVEIGFLIAFVLLFGVAVNRVFPIRRYSGIAPALDNKLSSAGSSQSRLCSTCLILE